MNYQKFLSIQPCLYKPTSTNTFDNCYFEVKDYHLSLLKRMNFYIDKGHYEYDIPIGDAKRLYGNSYFQGDVYECVMGEEIDGEVYEQLLFTKVLKEDTFFTIANYISKEVIIALQILTNNLSIETGWYSYNRFKWSKLTVEPVNKQAIPFGKFLAHSI